MAISKVSGQIVFGQIVHVSIACERDKELCYLQDEAVTVLQEAPLSWLPLTKFLTNFEKKYRRGLDVRHLEQIQDIVVLNGSAGCQTISLLEGKISVETLMVDTSFATDVVKLLHHFDGVIQLACFPALYWLEFHKEIKLCSTGSLLEELLSRVPNVTVVGNSKERYVQWVKKPDRDASKFERNCLLVLIYVVCIDLYNTVIISCIQFNFSASQILKLSPPCLYSRIQRFDWQDLVIQS